MQENTTSVSPSDKVYMRIADNLSSLSKAVRKKVGAVIVTSSGVIVPGVNGTPSGYSNQCEEETEWGLVTKDEVIHAETNCVLKAAKEGVSILDSSLYVTMSPCLKCAAMIAQSGVSRVFVGEYYRDFSGVELLQKLNIKVISLESYKETT